MCGIAGIARLDDAPQSSDVVRVDAMVRALRHRGPDADGVESMGPVTFGHARLSILDLSPAGRQPMAGRATLLTYNGELFDFAELRSVARGAGATVTSSGDTEVLLRLLELEWERCLPRLRGMFAFAAYSAERRELLLARDPLGKKPLFFSRQGDAVVFASEIAALAAGGVTPIPDSERIPEFLVRGYISAPHTLLRDVEQLEPGEAILFSSRPHVRRWLYTRLPWLGDRTPRRISSVAEAEAGIRERFGSAVRKRILASDVPVGAFLSGGFDSAAVVAAAHDAHDRSLQTFSIGFVGASDFDESADAARSAHLLGTEHRSRILDLDALDALTALTARAGEPQGDSSAIPTLAVSSFAAEHVKVVLTGDGGDELFAGYDRFILAYLAGVAPQHAGRWIASALRNVTEGPKSGRWIRRLKRLGRAVRQGPAATLMEWAGGTEAAHLEGLLGRTIDIGLLARPERDAIDGAVSRGAPLLHAILTANLATYLPGDVLVKVDRASMAVGLEARSPFLDEALLEYAAGLAPLLLARGMSLKWIAKRALAPLVPAEISSRRKRGFGAPVGHWFRRPGSPFNPTLLSPGARIAAHVDVGSLHRLVHDHAAGREEAGILLWRLLALENWLEWCAQAPATKVAA